jgi:hypothetical protein
MVLWLLTSHRTLGGSDILHQGRPDIIKSASGGTVSSKIVHVRQQGMAGP